MARSFPAKCARCSKLPVICLLCLFFWALPAMCQSADPVRDEKTPKFRPKIGLVLSGGGARGAAHVGVLKVLEEMRIPVDCIAGTSMGAVVGGMYAMGKSPAWIERSLCNMDWKEMLADRPPRDDQSFRRKEDDKRYLSLLDFGIKEKKMSTPTGLISGQPLQVTMDALCLQANCIDDFDSLPIPFRAVACDFSNGDEVVISKGRLSEAIRASMSIPTVFYAVELDGRMLVDGGIVNNIPVDVAKGMGAEVIIAVDIATPYLEKGEINSLMRAIGQTLNVLTRKNMEKNLKAATLLITPDLKEYTGEDFAMAAGIIKLGEDGARRYMDQLAPYSLSEEEWVEHRERQRKDPCKFDRIDSIRVEGTGKIDREIIERQVETKPGKISIGTLQDDLERLYDVGDFEKVIFSIDERDGKRDLVINTKEKSWGPNYIRFGLRLQTDFSGTSYFDLLGNYTRRRINSHCAEWRNEIRLGWNNRFYSEFYQPVGHHDTLFIAPSVEQSWWIWDYYDGGNRLAEYYLRNSIASLDFGAKLGTYGEIRIGPRWGRQKVHFKTGPEGLPQPSEGLTGLNGRLVIDRLDSAAFPSKGVYAQADYQSSLDGWGSDLDYKKFSGYYQQYFTKGKHTFFADLAGGSSMGTDLPFYESFKMGGLASLSAYREGEVSGDSFGLARFGYYYKIGNLSSTIGEGKYMVFWVEAGNAWMRNQPRNLEGLRYTGTVAWAADTNFGPLYFAVSLGDRGNRRVYISLGRFF